MNPVLIMEYLELWSDYLMHSKGDIAKLGFPKQSAGFARNGMTSFEDMDEGVNANIAHTMDAIITGLPVDMRHAVEFYFGLNTRVRVEILPMIVFEVDEFVLHENVLRRLWDGMIEKDLV